MNLPIPHSPLAPSRLLDTLAGGASAAARVAVVIPAYKVERTVCDVIARIGPECWRIYVVDDACPNKSGDAVEANCRDPRVRVLRNVENLGVGGAVMTGYRRAIEEGATIIVKIDGDGQMPPELLPAFVAPIVLGEADYAKGNRFYSLDHISRMPRIRIAGNALLSMLSKLSTGYWTLFDPTNGYTAIEANVARRLPFDKISQRYFFETDMLFRLNTLRAVVVDVPMDAVYGDEISNVRISRVAGEFVVKNLRNFVKRLFYNYCLRDFSIASLELVAGPALFAFGLAFGGYHWWLSSREGIATPVGTIMLATLGVLGGLQLILSFIGHDIASVPRRPIHRSLSIQPVAPGR